MSPLSKIIDNNPPVPPESTFYVKAAHQCEQITEATIIAKGPDQASVMSALADRGYTIDCIMKVTPPLEAHFRSRMDGTVLVVVCDQTRLISAYGPFNDEAEAHLWTSIARVKSFFGQDDLCATIEPDLAFRIEIVNGKPTVIDFPPGFFDVPL